MGTAINHPVPDRVTPSFVIFDIRALWRSGRQSVSECPNVKNYKWRLNPVSHMMLYSSTYMATTHMATGGVKRLTRHHRFESQLVKHLWCQTMACGTGVSWSIASVTSASGMMWIMSPFSVVTMLTLSSVLRWTRPSAAPRLRPDCNGTHT